MKSLLERYGIVFREGEGGGGGGGGGGNDGAAAAAAAAAPGAEQKPADTGSTLGDAARKAAETKAADEAAKKTADDAAAAEALKPKEYVKDATKTDAENEALKKAHDEAETKRIDEAKKAATDKDKKKPDDKADERTPEQIAEQAASYKLDPPEGFEVNPEIEKGFREFAAKRNLDQASVDELKKMQVDLYAKQMETHTKAVAKWVEDAKADKEIGGPDYDKNVGKAATILGEFFEPGALDILDQYGIGSHPEIVRGFVRMGNAFGEQITPRNGGGQESMSFADRFYAKSGAKK